ncbi:hypothetical protein ACN28C_28890 [Plantactinospora sp. WMMC1484]|uniref:hypothetical protein n=1 Tax=Plantactinospora sp. WMMC1484 TaxID=3404122 RepID=UPI003BF4A73E
MKRSRITRLAIGAVCAALLAITTTACAGQSDPQTTPAGAVTSARVGDSLDAHRADVVAALKFFALGPAAIPAEYYDSLSDGVKGAGAVVVAEVADVKVTRTFRGEHPEDVFQMIGVTLNVRDVVRGQLPAEFADRLTVEFMGRATDEQIESLKSKLSESEALWLVRRKGDPRPGSEPIPVSAEERQYFLTISPQGLFVQGADHVETPLAETVTGDMAAEGRRYARMSELVSAVRNVA